MSDATAGIRSTANRPRPSPNPAARDPDLDPRVLKSQYDTLTQQREAAALGMWIFLATEVLLFGGMMLGYTVYRWHYPAAWEAASHRTYYSFGTINTGVLLTSSLTMAMAVHAAEERQENGSRRALVVWLLLTALLGLAFLGFKADEYIHDIADHATPWSGFGYAGYPPGLGRPAAIFWSFYWVMTAVHATHLTIAIGIVVAMLILAGRRAIWSGNVTPVRVTALFWHLVDVIWVFLYPMFYLVGHR